MIPGVKKQFEIVSTLLNREDVDTIYVCTDSGREGEYIYRLVERRRVSTARPRAGCGLIPRQRRRSCAASGRPRTFLPMII